MRILILSTVRTRSSFFIDTVCQHYNLKNLYEYYRHLDLNIQQKSFSKKQSELWSKYKQATLEQTKLLDGFDNFAIKIHPSNFINVYKYHLSKETTWCMNDKDDIMPQDNLNIDSYDKIYYLTRNNFVDLYCSWIHGFARQKLLYTLEEVALSNLHRYKINLVFDLKTAKILLFDTIILEHFYKKFQDNKKDIVKLDYEDTVSYTKEHFSDIKSKYIDVKYNYKELIKNYDEIVEHIEVAKQELYQEINWDLFSK